MKQKHTPRAFSLIEAAIVLGIVGLVIGGIWVAASSISQKNKLNRTLEQITIVTQNIRQKIAPRLVDGEGVAFYNGTCGSGLACIPRTGWSIYLPNDMISAGSDDPLHAYGGIFQVEINTGGILFILHLNDNVQACAQLGPRIYSLIKKEADPLGQPTLVVTASMGDDISNPSSSGTACQAEFDTEGIAKIAFSIRL